MPLPLDPLGLLFAFVGLLVLGALTVIYFRCPGIGIGLFGCSMAWDVAIGTTPSVTFGIEIHAADALVMAALAAALIALFRGPRPRPSPELWAFAVLLLLLLCSLTAGALSHGLQSAGAEARLSFLQVFGAAVYVAVVHPGRDLLPALGRVWAGLALFYAALAALTWSKHGIGGSDSSYAVGDGHMVNGRPLTAAAALLICQAAVIMLFQHRRHAKVLAGVLLAVTLLLQHRSAWVSSLTMLSCWLLLRPGRRLNALAGTGAAVAAATATVLLARDLPLMRSLTESATNSQTLTWREDGWSALLQQLGGMRDWLLGLPFGTGYMRLTARGYLIGVTPHNYYVQMTLRVGLAGVVALALVLLPALRRVGRENTGLLLWLLTLGELSYWITYAPSLADGLLIGLLLRYAAQVRRRRSERMPQTPARTPRAKLTTHHSDRRELAHVPV